MDLTYLGISDRPAGLDCLQFCVDNIGNPSIETPHTNPTCGETPTKGHLWLLQELGFLDTTARQYYTELGVLHANLVPAV